MKKYVVLLLLTILLISCSQPQTIEELEQKEKDQVQEGFEEFLKEKQQQDQVQEKQELEQAQVRPETFERPKTKIEITIPDNLKKYDPQLTNCFEGEGSVEKVAAVASWCVAELAANNKDEQLCSLLTSEALDKCYQAVAKETKDKNLCNKISSDIIKSSCLEVIK